MTDRTPTTAGHIPTPSDICSTCGRGLVHVIPSLDPAEARDAERSDSKPDIDAVEDAIDVADLDG